jgi:DNA mismatch repair protein MutS2
VGTIEGMSVRAPEGGLRVVFAPPRPEAVADERTLAILDFPAVLERLAAAAASPLGRERAAALRPLGARRLVEAALEETDEARRLLDRGAAVPWEGLRDVRELVSRAARGGLLGGQELWWIAEALGALRRLRAFFRAHRTEAPRLAEWSDRIEELRDLEEALTHALGPEGEVLDRASPTLAALRQEVRRREAALRERLEELLRTPAVQAALQEPLVTVRRDRYVLPVRADQRAQVPGIVHDQSASGATVFVEPLAAVELGNALREARAREAAEVARILAALTEAVAGARDPLLAGLEVAGHLDLAMAKGRLSQAWDAVRPELWPESALELRQARHPLLASPVPVDLRLGRDFDALVLTGPNTGGKTVALKLTGLLVCLAQAGCHLPVAPGSGLGVFPRVAADAGDEQGVIQNLSTFSSHLRAVRAALDVAGPGALVLLDELGAGTDPAEGAALAMAIVEHLLGLGARVVVTTHYAELKAFAARTPRVANAAVAFDPETLAPTYRLVYGVPGASQAFDIARRLGLPEAILARAAALERPEERRWGEAVAGMLREEERLRAARREVEDERARLAAEREALEAERRDLAARRAAWLEAARREAEEVRAVARREAEAALREIRRLVEEAAAAERRAEALRQAEALARALAARAVRPAAPGVPVADVRPGQAVRVRGGGRAGTVAAVEGGLAVVQVGAMRLRVPVAELEPAPETEGEASARAAARPLSERVVQAECDLRGLRVDEALARVDKALDDAVLAGVPEIRLVHGKGTGALRQAVAEFLRGHPQVAAFRLAGAAEGGSGATVVSVKV